MSAPEEPTASAAARGTVPRRTFVLALLLLGGLGVLTAVPTWLSTTAATALDTSVVVTVSGTTAAPGVSAASLVVVAAALSLGLVGRVARWVSLAVVALAGVVVAGSALAFVRSPDAAARSGVAEATGVARPASAVDVSVAPYLTVAVGVAVLAVVVWAVVARVDWSHRTRRYDAPAAAGAGAAGRPPGAAESPAGPAPEGRGAATGSAAEAERGAAAGRPAARRAETSGTAGTSSPAGGDPLDDRDAWDSLTQGDDPT